MGLTEMDMGLKAGGPLFAVRDMERSLAFYREVLGLEVVNDFGANKVLTGGLSLQTLETWAEFLDKPVEDIRFGGNDAEMYYVAEDFDAFLDVLKEHPETKLIRPPVEHRWGQRAVRLYDPDGHIIEVGESLNKVAKRFRDSGLSEEGVARRMDISLEYARELLK